MEALEVALLLTVAGERLAEWLLKPFTQRIPWPEGWADYAEMLICAIPGFAFSLLARLDVFALLGINFDPAIAGVVITAIFIGGGSNLMHIFIDRVETSTRTLDWKVWEADKRNE